MLPDGTAVSAGEWVRATAPATSANLGPGFDALGLALQWREAADARLLPAGCLRVEMAADHAGDVPLGAENLTARAAAAVLARAGRREGLHLRLHARLPVGAGLGSSAAAIVCGLCAANRLLGGPLAPDELLALATDIEGHPDNVAPALLGGFCAACLAGPRVWVVRLDPPAGLRAVLAIPSSKLSTHAARAVLPAQVPFGDAVANVQRACLLVAAVAAGRVDALAEATADRLHQPYRAPLLPGLQEALEAARAAGAAGVFLSGAGPTVMALSGPAERHAVAAALAGALQRMGGGRVHDVALGDEGALAVPIAASDLRLPIP